MATIAPVAVGPIATDVSGTLVDKSGTVWNGATVIAIFMPAANIPGPYFSNGEYDFPRTWTGTTDANGYFEVQLADNSAVTPAGSMWEFVIAPAATMPAVVMRFQIVGPAIDISPIFTAQSYQLQNSRVMSMSVPRAYRHNEVAIPANSGQIYYNASGGGTLFIWNGSVWTDVSGSFHLNTANLPDMNEFDTEGTYYFHVNVGANAPSTLTAPNAGGNVLVVYHNDSLLPDPTKSTNVVQLFYTNNDPASIYQRIRTGGNWTAWFRFTGAQV